jgi:hypothetical protein
MGMMRITGAMSLPGDAVHDPGECAILAKADRH